MREKAFWAVNVLIPGYFPDGDELLAALEDAVGKSDASGFAINPDGTPGAHDACWYRDSAEEGAALRDRLLDELRELAPSVEVIGPEFIPGLESDEEAD